MNHWFWFYLYTVELPLVLVGTWCGLDGAVGSATAILGVAAFSTAQLWPLLSRSHARRSVAAGTR